MRLEEVCEFIVDCPHSTAQNEGAGYPLIRTPNIGRGRLLLDGVHRVSKTVYNKRNQRAVPQEGDLIFAREAPAGNVALISAGQQVCLGQRTVLIRPDKNRVDPAYLTFYLLTPECQHALLSTANGATVAHVNLPTIRQLPISLPPLKEQQKIAGILSAYDDLIDNNQQQIKLLEEAVKLYLLNFFKENNSNHWTNYAFPEVFDVIRGRSYKSADIASSTGKLFVNLKNIKAWGGYKRNAEKRYSGEFQHCQTLLPGDLIMGMTDMTQDRRLVGHVAKVPHLNEEAIFSMDIAKIVPKVGTANYLYYYLRYSDVSTSIANLANGANVLHLRQESLKSIMLKLPSDELIAKFDTLTSPIATQIELLEDCNQLLQEARDRLLPKLLSGEIEV